MSPREVTKRLPTDTPRWCVTRLHLSLDLTLLALACTFAVRPKVINWIRKRFRVLSLQGAKLKRSTRDSVSPPQHGPSLSHRPQGLSSFWKLVLKFTSRDLPQMCCRYHPVKHGRRRLSKNENRGPTNLAVSCGALFWCVERWPHGKEERTRLAYLCSHCIL
jgi:hypothetical protein